MKLFLYSKYELLGPGLTLTSVVQDNTTVTFCMGSVQTLCLDLIVIAKRVP